MSQQAAAVVRTTRASGAPSPLDTARPGGVMDENTGQPSPPIASHDLTGLPGLNGESQMLPAESADSLHDEQVPTAETSPPPQDEQPPSPEEDTAEGSDPDYSRSPRAGARTSLGTHRKKQQAMPERMHQHLPMPLVSHGVEHLLHMHSAGAEILARPVKRMRDMDDYPGPRNRRHKDEFNASQLIGSIFMRVQGAKAPAPLVYFEDDITQPLWFKESIDGVQPVAGSSDFDPEEVNLESMGKLVEGAVLPATLGEVAAYFSHVLGDPRTNREIAPRVLIAIQCDRAKGWFTYKRDNDNSNFVPVVLCAAEGGRGGLEEVSPAHFEVHRAQCAQKKWRQSFKVLGAQKLHKVTSLAQAALGDVLRHLERILGAEKPMLVMRHDPNLLSGTAANGGIRLTAANHPTFRQPMDMVTDDGVRLHSHNSLSHNHNPLIHNHSSLASRATNVMVDASGGMIGRAPGHVDDGTGPTMMANGNLGPGPVHRLGRIGSQVLGRLDSIPNGLPRPIAGRPAGLVGARPMATGMNRHSLTINNHNKPQNVLRRHTDDPSARPHLPGHPPAHLPPHLPQHLIPGLGTDLTPRGLDLLATAASSAGITSPRGGVQPGVQAGLVAAALGGVSFNELLQLVVDNNARRQHHAQQAQLITQLSQLQSTQAAADHVDLIVGGAGHGDGLALVPNCALNRAEREAISVIVQSVRGADVAHAVRGILQHVAMQYVGEAPTSLAAAPALAEALVALSHGAGLAAQIDPTEDTKGTISPNADSVHGVAHDHEASKADLPAGEEQEPELTAARGLLQQDVSGGSGTIPDDLVAEGAALPIPDAGAVLVGMDIV